MFVCGYLCVDNRLKIPPYFSVLQNPQASIHYYFILNVNFVFLSLVNFFHPDFGIQVP
jgi:hypothetical protein